MDALTLLIGLAFYLLFIASIVRYLRHRAALELAVVLVFSSTAALFAVALINAFLPALGPYLGPVAVTLLVAQPALMVRLVAFIVPLPRWAEPAAVVGCTATVLGFYATNRSVPSILFLVGYFAVTECLAASVLIREARRRRGFPRLRLTTAGIASLLFGLSIIISGLGAAARGGAGAGDPSITVVSRLLALIAGLGYLAAFSPPRWLRDLGHRALAFDLVRSIVAAPTGTQPIVLWSALADAAGSILGTSRVWVIPSQVTDDGWVAGESGRLAASSATERGHSIEIELVSERGPVATLQALLPGRPLFLEDDIALIELLGSLTARAVERERAIAGVAEAEREVSEAAAIRASEARFRVLLDAEPNAILSVDDRGIILWSTRSAAGMFGADRAGLVGRRFDAFVRSEHVARRAGRLDAGVSRFETIGMRQDGHAFPVEVAQSPVELDGRPATIVVVTDISWRQDAEAVRDRFVGVLSHELRTPITSIFGGAQVLLHHGSRLDERKRVDLLTDIAAEAERLQRMVENLLILARVDQGAGVVDLSPVLLHRLLPTVIERERATWPEMTFETEIPRSLPVVAGDDASLTLVIRNLLSNAGKYAGPAASVRVSVDRDTPETVTVTIADDGPGLDPDDLDRVFGLYFRSQTAAAAPGSGIGLFVCRALVAAMGGRIWAVANPSGGAAFAFTLPVYADERLDADEPAVGDATPMTVAGRATTADR